MVDGGLYVTTYEGSCIKCEVRKCETYAQCCILQRLQTKSTRCQRE